MIYFVSDLHLGLGSRTEDKARERDFLRFLRAIRSDCETLFILGDLFDYWFEYNTVIPKFHIRTLAELALMRDEGISIYYIMGNHDFGHKNYFEEELDIPIYKNDLEITLHGKRFYLAHGDGKAYNDTGYLILRSILRNPFCQWLYKWIHPDIGIPLASSSSHASRDYTGEKNYGKRDGLRDFAEKRIEAGADFVLMGHRHKPHIEKMGAGFYVNLGDLLSNRTLGIFDGNSIEICSVDEFLKTRES